MTIFKRTEEPRPAAPGGALETGEPAGAAAEAGGEMAGAAAAPRDVSARPAPEPAPAGADAPAGMGTVLAPGTVFEGTLHAAEPVRVGGTLQGTLEAEGAVLVEAGGRLVARVVAPTLVVAGFVDGRVQCQGRLEIRATGFVKGKLQVGTLRIEEGALLDGQLQMAGAVGAATVSVAEPAAAGEAPRPRRAARAPEAPSHPEAASQPLAVAD